MKKLINRKNCIAIVIALLLMTLGMPVNAQRTLKKWQNLSGNLPGAQPDPVVIGVSVGVGVVAVTVAVIAVALVKKHKKKMATADNLIFNNDCLAGNDQ